MEDIANNIGSIAWWFSVVLVGVLVNLLASFLKPRIEYFISKYSKKLMERRKNEKQKWEDDVNKIISEDHYKDLIISKISSGYGVSNFFMWFSIFWIINSYFLAPYTIDQLFSLKHIEINHHNILEATLSVAFFAFGMLCFLFAVNNFIESFLLQSKIEEATKRKTIKYHNIEN